MKSYVNSHGLRLGSLNSPSIFLRPYFAKQRSLYDFGVFLRSAVAVAQFPIFSVTPAEHLKEMVENSVIHFKESEEFDLTPTEEVDVREKAVSVNHVSHMLLFV